MGWQVIKQPNDLYCIFSSVVDHFVYINLSKEELIEVYRFKRGQEGVDALLTILDKLEKGEKPYYQFTRSFDDAVSWIKEFHGKFEVRYDENNIIYEEELRNKVPII